MHASSQKDTLENLVPGKIEHNASLSLLP